MLMNEQIFWTIIEESKGTPTSPTAQIDAISLKVEGLITPRIYKFHKIYNWVLEKANLAELFIAAYILNAGCDDEEFILFRSWLILQGQKIYKNALENPETLCEYAYFFKRESNLIYRCIRFPDLAIRAFNAQHEHIDFWNEYPYDVLEKEVKGEMPESEDDMVDVLPLLCKSMGWGNEIPKGHWVSDQAVPMGQK